MKLHLHQALAGLLFTSMPLAIAQGLGGPQPRLVLEALDTNHDAALSSDEIKAAPRTLLTLDRNLDGQLTFDELQPRPEQSGASASELVTRLMVFDKNHNGVLTPDELPARMQSLFQRADANHDGKLTPDELNLMAEHQGIPAGPPNPNVPVGIFMRLDPLLNTLDADHDGTISATEIAGAPAALATLDLNHDGTLSPAEIRPRQQTPAERADHMLDEWDTNKDGKISKDEAPGRVQEQFSSVDKNNDGYLDKDELVQFFNTPDSGSRNGDKPGNNRPNAMGPTGNEKEQR